VSPDSPSTAGAPGLRARAAIALGSTVAAASRTVGLGSGSVIGGRASLLVHPGLLRDLTASRDVIIVSATNGKTTTTRLITAALAGDRPVVSNSLGANMEAGIAAAIGQADPSATAVLEVDERWVPGLLRSTRAGTVVLLNLSRDQLDRSQEVRHLAEAWRTCLAETPPAVVVANADDPLVAWAAGVAPRVIWIATGQSWHADAAGCPECAGRISFGPRTWRCTDCGLARPDTQISVDDTSIITEDGRFPIAMGLPGHINRVNAAFALATAISMGVAAATAVEGIESIREVAGRYRIASFNGRSVRLLLAKNPAGWHEAIELLAAPPAPVIISINARIADGHDPSWLWDVEFERLRSRFVVATGERRHDLAVRLRYAGVEHIVAETIDDAVRVTAGRPEHRAGDTIDIAANYTAFQQYHERFGADR
jgi:lipid II isoglutaminyl synthase (glutamine-hydrolysing)